MAETLSTLSVISFAIAGICLALALFFWFLFKIPTVIGDLSGRIARKSVAKMRAINEKNGVKSYKTSKTNLARGKLTSDMPSKGDLNNQEQRPETGLLKENLLEQSHSEETGMLNSVATEMLVNEEGTTQSNIFRSESVMHKGGMKLTMIEDVLIVHTDEVIQ